MDNQNPTQAPPVSPTPSAPSPVVEIGPPQPEPQQPPPSSKFSFSPKIMLAILAFLIILVAGSGIYLSQSSKPVPTPTPTPAQAKASEPTPTTDLTAGWATFGSKGCNFEFKYPPAWRVEFENQYYTTVILMRSVHIDTPAPPLIYSYDISCRDNQDHLSAEDWINNQLSSHGVKTPINSREYISNNITWLETTDYPSASGGSIIYAYNDDKIYLITLSPFSEAKQYQKQEEFKSVLLQILSTFKFTDTPTSSSKTDNYSDQDVTEIKNGISQRDGIPIDEDVFSIDEYNNFSRDYLSGDIPSKEGKRKWFATKIDGKWNVIWTGNDLPKCSDISKYNLPKDFLDCY